MVAFFTSNAIASILNILCISTNIVACQIPNNVLNAVNLLVVVMMRVVAGAKGLH